jgi:hypothetical protein
MEEESGKERMEGAAQSPAPHEAQAERAPTPGEEAADRRPLEKTAGGREEAPLPERRSAPEWGDWTGMPPFQPDLWDAAYAAFLFAMAWFFGKHVLFYWSGLATTGFTLAYLAAEAFYFARKGHALSRYSLAWLASSALCSLGFALFDGEISKAVRALFLIASSSYFAAAATSSLCIGPNCELGDLGRTFFLVPFANIANHAKALFSAFFSKRKKSGNALKALGGGAIAALLLAIVSPLLFEADAGAFSGLFEGLSRFFQETANLSGLGWLAFAAAISPYWFGIMSGYAHKRVGSSLEYQKISLLSAVTANVAVGILLAWYAFFIASQIPYFFSALSGTIPQGAVSYAEYARKGFFELTAVTAINLVVIGTVTRYGKEEPGRKTSRALNVALVAESFVFLITAFSKMALYISHYGFTQLRVATSVFMAFLAVLLALAAIVQKRGFPVLKTAAFAAIAIILFFSFANVDKWIIERNTERFLAGSVSGIDLDTLRRSGSAGVDSAIEIMQKSAASPLDWDMKQSADVAGAYLETFLAQSEGKPWFRKTLEESRALEKIRRFMQSSEEGARLLGNFQAR